MLKSESCRPKKYSLHKIRINYRPKVTGDFQVCGWLADERDWHNKNCIWPCGGQRSRLKDVSEYGPSCQGEVTKPTLHMLLL